MPAVDLTEFALIGICVDAKNIGTVYDIQKSYESSPRIYIHLTTDHSRPPDYDAILITRPFSNKANMQEALHRLIKLRESAKPLHLKSVT